MWCPKLRERIGEDPARWLDWDMLADPYFRALVFSVIDSIDTYERLEAWQAAGDYSNNTPSTYPRNRER